MGFIGDSLGDILDPGDFAGRGNAEAARKGADAQAQAAREATELTRQVYQQGRTDQLPWLAAGQAALNPLLALTGLPQVTQEQLQALSQGPLAPPPAALPPGAVPSKELQKLPATPPNALTQAPTDVNALLRVDPSYQFRLGQGQKALERSAAARGGLVSGGFAKDLTDYAQGAASQEYSNIWNRYANIAGVGSTTANNLGGQGQNYAQQAAGLMGDAANARASGYAGAAAATSQGKNNLLGLGLMAASAFSDRRLKSDVVRVGMHDSGLPLYEYTIFGRRERGVMADEAQKLRPEAVTVGPGGFLMVNYGAL